MFAKSLTGPIEFGLFAYTNIPYTLCQFNKLQWATIQYHPLEGISKHIPTYIKDIMLGNGDDDNNNNGNTQVKSEMKG